MSYYAIDFGTSNSLLNYISKSGAITPVPMDEAGGYILRSLIFTPQNNEWYFGNDAILQYVENDGEGRFLRSLKKFLAEPSYSGTEIHSKTYKIENLVAIFLREMKRKADKFTGLNIQKVIMGRPAKYSQNHEYDQLAEERMKKACELSGFKEIIFCPEPLAAGLDFDKLNKKQKLVLIADFGGGTSDFTLMKLHAGTYSQKDILGISGIFKAGDALDGEMMRKFISKHFGADFEFKLPMGNQTLSFPKNLLIKICSPAHITHLREKEVWNYLKGIHKFAKDEVHKRKLDQLFTLVECQLGYPIFQRIEDTKINISKEKNEFHQFKFSYPGVDIQEDIPTTKYNEVMSPIVMEIMNTMREVFTQSGYKAEDVDEVVLTGGTAQFYLIQEQFKLQFGEKKLIEHDVYQSVVGGLSQYALTQL